MASTCACILGQSSTASRTSESTRCSASSSAAASSSSLTRVISICIHDSRIAPSGAATEPSSTPETRPSSPVMSRSTSICGWITTRTSRSWLASSIVSESTRNGMSSVTTWTVL